MDQNKIQNLDGFSQKFSIQIAWGEMDSYLHVNNAMYFRYFESARIESFAKDHILESMSKNKIGPILAETSCKFIRPITFPDTIEVGIKSKILDDFAFIQEYGIYSTAQKRIVALGTGKIVFFDYNIQSKTKIPATILNLFLENE